MLERSLPFLNDPEGDRVPDGLPFIVDGHVHLFPDQCFDMNSQAMGEVYEACMLHRKPLIMHVGREPKSPAYPCDPYELCSAAKLERVLEDYPDLPICVPHLGLDEFDEYRDLIDKYDNLWLDTTMTLADYFPIGSTPNLSEWRSDRIIFGTDFPNLPYAWDREINKLVSFNLSNDTLAKILGQNACVFYGIKTPVAPE